MRPIDDRTYDDLIGTIYAAGVDPTRWSDVCDRLGSILDGAYIALHGHDFVAGCSTGLVCTRYDPDFIGSYVSHYAALNPWVPAQMCMPLGKAVYAEDMCSRDALERTEFYADWVRPQEDIGTGGGIVLHRSDQRLFGLTCNLRFRDGEDKQATTMDFLDRIAPHLARSFAMLRHVARLGETNGAAMQVIDALPNALFLLDRRGRIAACNAAAEAIMADGGPCFVDAAQRLRLRSPHCDTALDAALDAALAAANRGRPADLPPAFALPSPSGAGFYAETIPLMAPDEPHAFLMEFAASGRPILALSIADARQPLIPSAEVLTRLFALTPAESRLAQALAGGATLSEYAAAAGLSRNTARVQLQSVMHKTETRRQAELVSLLARLPRAGGR